MQEKNGNLLSRLMTDSLMKIDGMSMQTGVLFFTLL